MFRRTFWIVMAIAILAQVGMSQNQRSFDVEVSGKGKPVIFIPGLASAGSTWDDTVKHYQDRFECHVLTLAGRKVGKWPYGRPVAPPVRTSSGIAQPLTVPDFHRVKYCRR